MHDKLGADARFTDGDLRVAEIFAARAAVAVSLSERVARDTVRRVIEAQESERRRLALELHDETGQALTSILLGLKAIRASPKPSRMPNAPRPMCARSSSRRCRTFGHSRSSSGLRRSTTSGSCPAIERLAETFSERSGIETMVEANLDERLPPEIETTLYRVVQEALTNVVKHAGAEHVSIVISGRARSVAVTVDDDGSGLRRRRRSRRCARAARDARTARAGRRQPGGRVSSESGTTIAAQVPLIAAAAGVRLAAS